MAIEAKTPPEELNFLNSFSLLHAEKHESSLLQAFELFMTGQVLSHIPHSTQRPLLKSIFRKPYLSELYDNALWLQESIQAIHPVHVDEDASLIII